MLLNLKKILLTDPYKWKYWILIAFITRLSFFLLVIHFRQYDGFKGFWGGIRGDSSDYLLPFENLIKTGNYQPDIRMPGYGLLYFPLKLIFSKSTACNIIIITQLILSTISVYALALSAKNIFKNNAIFFLTFYMYAISSFSSLVDPVLLAESLSTSSLVFSVYYLTSYLKTLISQKLFISGFFLTWCIFLRPVFCPLLIIFFIIIIVALIRAKAKLFPAFLFIIPFFLIDGAWIIRNYIKYSEIVPLTRTVWFPSVANSYLLPTAEFVEAWGGEIQFVESWSDTYWFVNGKSNTDTVPFPKYIYTSQFNKDSLKKIKSMITFFNTDSSMNQIQRKQYEANIIEKLHKYTLSIKKEKPFLYFIQSNFKRLSNFLLSIHTVSRLYVNNFITLFYNAFYYISIFLALLGFILMIPFIFRVSPESIFALIAIYDIFIHPIFIKFDENRYLIPVYPFIIICACYSLFWTYNKLTRKKHI